MNTPNAFDWQASKPQISFARVTSSEAKFRNRGTNRYGNAGAPIDLEMMREFRNSGMTFKQCGYAFGVDESTAYRRLKSYAQRTGLYLLDKKVNNSGASCFFSDSGERDRRASNA